MHTWSTRRWLPALALPLVLASFAGAGCDLVTANAQETSEWHKTYTLDAKGRVDIENVNGRIVVEPSTGNSVEVSATKKARASNSDAAKAALDRITIVEDVSSSHVKIETKVANSSAGIFGGGGLQVEYHVKVPAGAEVHVTTVNGGVEVTGVQGHLVAETTNGEVSAKDVSGELQATTTNGGLDIDLARMPEGGVKLECTNGGIKVRLPKDAKANITASITNGGIESGGLSIETTGENTRRRLEGRLNGGGPRLDIDGTNGGITIAGR